MRKRWVGNHSLKSLELTLHQTIICYYPFIDELLWKVD